MISGFGIQIQGIRLPLPQRLLGQEENGPLLP